MSVIYDRDISEDQLHVGSHKNLPAVLILFLNLRFKCLEIYRKREYMVRPAGDGETQVVSERCLTSLSGHLLRPVGIGPPCFSFIRYILRKDKN